MTEPATDRVLDRVGRALGEREGTGPDAMPWLRRHREEARSEGRVEIVDAIRRKLLAPREIPVISDEVLLDALLEPGDQAAFRARGARWPRRRTSGRG